MAPSLACARRLGFAALLIVSGGAAASVHAQEGRGGAPETTLSETPELSGPEADRQARTLFEQGRAAYDEGRYRDSWDYFRQAYLLSKRPELLYNVGQSADRLRKDREALEAFRMYLAQVPKAENRREVENRVRALEQRMAEAPPMETAPPPAGADPAYAAPAPETIAGEPAGTPEAAADGDPYGARLEHGRAARAHWLVRARRRGLRRPRRFAWTPARPIPRSRR